MKKTINVTKTVLPPFDMYTKYLEKIWSSRWVTNDGELVKKLEKKLIKILDIRELTLVGNGTIGLQLALKALQLKGEVITTPFTFAATTNVIIWEGLVPVFADINPDTFNIDPDEIEKKITKNTTAILAVHVFGNPCDIESLIRIAKRHKIKLIFDAAHAFGVKYGGKSILMFGDVSVLSFHATKTFHTIEGGAVISNNKKLNSHFKLLRNFGIRSEEKVHLCGVNAKMNEFQAAMGLSNIPYISSVSKKRKQIYMEYKNNLQNLKDVRFQKITTESYNYAYVPVLFKNKKVRDYIFAQLLKKGVKARKYFYPLTSDFPYIKNKRLAVYLPNSKKVSNSILCLPIFADMEVSSVKKISSIIVKSING